MTVYKALHLRDKRGRLYVSRKEGDWTLTNIEDCLYSEIKKFEEYTK